MILALVVLLFLGEVNASPRVSLDLEAYVDAELNIERIDDNGTLDIFDRSESRYRITSNISDNVFVTVTTQNHWQLKSDKNKFIPYEGVFKGRNEYQVLNEKNNRIEIPVSDFNNSQEYEFSLIFKAIGSMKNFEQGLYKDCINIEVTAKK